VLSLVGAMNMHLTGLPALIFILVLILLYFLPTFIAARRKTSLLVPTILVNIFLGWTVIGWIGALIMSFLGRSRS
jgi:hypothetical protein